MDGQYELTLWIDSMDGDTVWIDNMDEQYGLTGWIGRTGWMDERTG